MTAPYAGGSEIRAARTLAEQSVDALLDAIGVTEKPKPNHKPQPTDGLAAFQAWSNEIHESDSR